jgi:hypothetical protein
MNKYIIKIMLLLSILCIPFLKMNLIQAEENKIALLGTDDQRTEFPPYITEVSPYVKGLVDGKFKEAESKVYKLDEIPDYILEHLKDCVEKLPEAARDKNGRQVDATKINNKTTLFVHFLVKEAISPIVSPLSKLSLGKLYHTAHYLQIEPLTNALAYFISQRVYTTSGKEGKEQQKKWIKKKFGLEKKDHLRPIQKHLYLLQNGRIEYSIGDYIGYNGQPFIDEKKTLDLSAENLTSLRGIEWIDHAGEIKTLRLYKNYLLGPDIDTS